MTKKTKSGTLAIRAFVQIVAEGEDGQPLTIKPEEKAVVADTPAIRSVLAEGYAEIVGAAAPRRGAPGAGSLNKPRAGAANGRQAPKMKIEATGDKAPRTRTRRTDAALTGAE